MKKKLDTNAISNELKGASVFFQRDQAASVPQTGDLPHQDSVAQKDEQVSEPLSKDVSTPSDNQRITRTSEGAGKQLFDLSIEDIEVMSFTLRKVHKTKINTEIADEWKEEVDRLAFELKVGNYELVEYIIGLFLGKVAKKST